MYELLSSEYGWRIPDIAAMTFMQRHLYLDRLLNRKKKESGAPAEVPLTTDFRQLGNALD